MLLFDLLLVSVIVVTAYLGPMVLRRLGPGQRLYGWMLVGDLALAATSLVARRGGEAGSADLIGTVAIGGGLCLVFVPPVLRNLARRALLSDRLRLARALVDARELLQPGMGARQESELISTILEVRSGQVEVAVGRLRERRDRLAEPVARRPLDERIVMTYLYARRWDEAVTWYEQHVQAPRSPLSPQLEVEMVRAYCERGELLKAAALVERLEGAPPANEPIWSLLLHRARLVFLAFAGRTEAVDSIVGPGGPLGAMPESARCYWTGMARLRAGDRSGARHSLTRSAALSGRDDRSREQAESTLRRLDEPGVAGPFAMPDDVNELADRLSLITEESGKEPREAGTAPRSQNRTPRLSGVGWREVPVTSALVAANVLIAAALALATGQLADLGALARFGANVKSATLAGEWWRLIASCFLHFGALHLALNMYGLWVLGRLVEQFHGRRRMLVVYVMAGIGGAAASLAFGGPSTSAGASGAVFGLLGAAVAELALHRADYPRRWSGALLGNLLFLAVANVVIGVLYPIIDQAAHLGGFGVGALLGALLSRKLSVAPRAWMQGLVGALVVASSGALAYGALGAATSDLGATLASYPRDGRLVGGLRISVPAPWMQTTPHQIEDPSLLVMIVLERVSADGSAGLVDRAIAERREWMRTEGVRQRELTSAHQVDDVKLALPPPWRSRELVVAMDDGAGGSQRFRMAAFGREAGAEMWFGFLQYPESLGDELGPTIAAALSSARAEGPIPAVRAEVSAAD